MSELSITALQANEVSQGWFWFDTSVYPHALKVYNGSNWGINNELVYLGSITVAQGLITGVNNRYFNACLAKKDLIDSYQYGTTGYFVYSNGWCEQWGEISPGIATKTVNLLKEFANTNYNVTLTPINTSASIGSYVVNSRNTNSFSYISNTAEIQSLCWRASGYID